MKWQMTYNETENTVIIKTSGVLETASATTMRNEGWEFIKQHGCLRCLLDHSDLEGYLLQTLDIYNIPKIYKEIGIPHSFRMAVIVPKILMKDLYFYETVCRNNGYFVSLFFEQEDAWNWLKK